MKRAITILLAAVLILGITACGKQAEPPAPEKPKVEPQLTQMKSICELAVMDCYYHNVAKLTEKDAEGFLFWKKDKHFWVEYSGIVKYGIDASYLSMEVNGDNITIYMPQAEILSCQVDSESITEDSFIIDKDSASLTVEDAKKAISEAQSDLEEKASSDSSLIAQAQQRAKLLLSNYIETIGSALDKDYNIEWVLIDKNNSNMNAPQNNSVDDSSAS